MVKRHNWASAMFGVMTDHQGRSFEWGVNDCCLFVARTIDAMTGGDVEARISVVYRDERSAFALMAKHGGLFETATHFLGEPTEERAVRGDAVGFDGGEGQALGICIGSTIVAMGKAGLMSLPRSAILKVWKP